MHARRINPDDYLQTETGRLFTEERRLAAWERTYDDLEAALRNPSPPSRLYMVIGVQGAGKTTWVHQNASTLGNAVFLDAALPAVRHRSRALAIAQGRGIPVVAVWINVPLEVALTRNALRPVDERVPEAALRNVFSTFQGPSIDEGFAEVIEVADFSGKSV